MSCATVSQNDVCTSVLGTSSACMQTMNANGNNSNSPSSSSMPKTSIVQAGTQLIITTTSIPTANQVQKIVSQPGQTQKIVSVSTVMNNTNDASSSAIGSSSSMQQALGTNVATGSSVGCGESSLINLNTTSQHSPNQLSMSAQQTALNDTAYTTSFYAHSHSTPAKVDSQSNSCYQSHTSTLELDGMSFEFDGHVSHTAQAAPITVQWLVDNFEPAEGHSLKRSTLYNFYMHHCSEQKLEPVNPASFGKLIRSVFLGLRTRRLGTRGNSKYHYCGIRVKDTSPLNQIPEDGHYSMGSKSFKVVYVDQPSSTHKSKSHHHHNSGSNNNVQSTGSTVVASTTTTSSSSSWSSSSASSSTNSNMPKTYNGNGGGDGAGGVCTVSTLPSSSIVPTTQTNPNAAQQPLLQQVAQLNDDFFKLTNNLPNFGEINIENILLPENCFIEDLRKFEDLYKNHCERTLDLVIGLKLSSIDNVWKKFWRCSGVDYTDYEHHLPTEKFISLCNVKAVVDFVEKCDYQFYQFCVDTLIPDVLYPLPGEFKQQIRSFVKSLECWSKNALLNIPTEMQQIKMRIINAFAMTLRRYTALNHIAQATKAVLEDKQQITQMLSDLNRVDFHHIQEQVSWVFECEDYMLGQFVNEFKQTLQEQHSLDEWAKWLDSVVLLYLKPYEGAGNYAKMARQFLLKWSFYCSAVISDLTLRSASSFGNFHLIRLFYDEYMFYLIEHKIAKASNLTSIAVMSEMKMML